MAVNLSDPNELMANTQSQGLMKSLDQGATWTPIVAEFAKAGIMHIAYDKSSPNIVYVLAQDLSIHKTSDGGETWRVVRRKS